MTQRELYGAIWAEKEKVGGWGRRRDVVQTRKVQEQTKGPQGVIWLGFGDSGEVLGAPFVLIILRIRSGWNAPREG